MQAGVFSASEPDLDGLALEVQDAKRVLLISGSLVQVRECSQRGQYSVGAVEKLHLEHVKRGGCRGFRCVDVQPENQVAQAAVDGMVTVWTAESVCVVP